MDRHIILRNKKLIFIYYSLLKKQKQTKLKSSMMSLELEDFRFYDYFNSG